MVMVVLVVSTACSGGKPGTFAVGKTSPKASSTAKPTQQQVPRGELGQPAPARLFSGTNSVLGQLLRYCKGSACEDASARSPAYLVAKSGRFAMFTIGSIPLQASAEVRTHPSEKPATVTLDPNDVMIFDYGLGPGRYLVDLVVRWKTAAARWRFGLKISS